MNSSRKFIRLFEPFRVRQMELRNRIVKAPQVTNFASEDGYVTERIKNYYEAIARGGVGLIIIEATYVHEAGRSFRRNLGISDDKFVPGLSELALTIHKYGAKVAIQLQYDGITAPSLAYSGRETPKELTVDEIGEIITHFAEASQRAKRAGFDGVEIHGAHGYFINQFLSPALNKRKDKYGGSTQNRARLLTEVIRAIRKEVGESYAVWCRINGKEYGVDGGTTLEDAQKTARMAEDAGADAIHVSASGPESPTNLTTPTFVPGVITDLAEGIKKAVNIPIIAVGRISPEAGEEIITEGKADLIAIGKGLFADPELPNKVASGRLEDITPCIICMRCRDELMNDTPEGILCQVNALLGKEGIYKITQARDPKKVLVVGGGPAGMEAARVSALRGHRVTLYEKEPRLGGQLIQAGIPPYKDSIQRLIRYLEAQVRKLGVEIELRSEATGTSVQQFSPDVVVIATGAKPIVPEIPGSSGNNVVTVLEALNEHNNIGQRVVVVGGGSTGCEVAEFLSGKGKDVRILEMQEKIGSNVGLTLEKFMQERLAHAGIRTETNVIVTEISEKGVIGLHGDVSQLFEADTVVLAAGMKPVKELTRSLLGKVREVHYIGDCVEPRRIGEAIAEGLRTALSI